MGKPLPVRLAMFGGLGVVSLAMNLALTTGLVELAGTSPRLAFASALAVVYLLNFAACRWGIFRGQRMDLSRQLLAFSVLSLGFRGLEYVMFLLLLEPLGLPYLAAALLALGGSFLLKFTTYDRLVFRS